jgi:RNA polymerase sigma factor (sigma-70 family)
VDTKESFMVENHAQEETTFIADENQLTKYLHLCQFIEQHWLELLPSIRVQIKKLNLAADQASVENLAQEILNDAIAQALKNCDKYDPDRPVFPWLRKIAFNQALMLRRRRNLEDQYIALVGDETKKLSAKPGFEQMAEDEMFSLLYRTADVDFDGNLALNDLLALVKTGDREVLGLAFVYGLRGKALAAKLGITEGAAWVRLNRAIVRLREAYIQNQRLSG